MKERLFTSATILGLAIGVLTAPIYGQGQGKGGGKGHEKAPKAEQSQSREGKQDKDKGKDKDKDKDKAHSNAPNAHDAQGNAKGHGVAKGEWADKREKDATRYFRNNAPFARYLKVSETRPSIRRFIESNKNSERVAAGAVAYAYARGINERDFVINQKGNEVFVRNRRGDVLLDIDDDRARDMGSWKVRPLDDRVTGGAPSFCRSGAGHPVWGREWCIDKGFGLGRTRNIRWGFTDDFDRVITLRPIGTSNTVAADMIARVLGTTATDRLALHAISLGLVDPLVGRWLGEPSGQRVLLVNSGDTPVAEFIDDNRDDRVDRSLFALMPW